MLGQIINAITQEAKYFVKDNEGLAILDTNLDNDIAFSFPFILISRNGTPESARLPGDGTTRLDWSFSISVYNQEPDAYIDDDLTGSSSHLNFSDTVRNHFATESWITQLMVDLTNNYDFRMTYVGSVEAKPLETEDKTYMGEQHNFETISFDRSTSSIELKTITSQGITGSIEFD